MSTEPALRATTRLLQRCVIIHDRRQSCQRTPWATPTSQSIPIIIIICRVFRRCLPRRYRWL